MVRSLGADHVIDYTREDFTEGEARYDVILDMVGTHSLGEYRRVMAPTGIYVLVGTTDKGRWLGPIKDVIKAAGYSRLVGQQMGFMLATMNQDDLTTLGDLMRTGKVTPVIDRRYTLAQAPEAIRYLEEGHARGKVVITMDEGAGTAPSGAAPDPGPAGTTGPALIALAIAAVAIGGPIVAAFALNRRFSRRNPGKRPYRWGYYVSIQSAIEGLALGIVLESGVGVAIVCAVVYATLAWCFARRQRWAWIALTIASLNPVVWLVNAVYFWKRWSEDSAARA